MASGTSFCLALQVAGLLAFQGNAEPLGAPASLSTLVAITAADASALQSRLLAEGFDVLPSSDGGRFEAVVTPDELKSLRSRGLSVSVIRTGRPLRGAPPTAKDAGGAAKAAVAAPSGYQNMAEILSAMKKIEQDFPAIAKVVDLTDKYQAPPTVEGRHICALKISDNVDKDEDETSMLVVSGHHCREVVTPVIALYAMRQLTSRYASDSVIRAAVDSHEFWIAPVWNPDGYEYVMNTDDLWRKNRHVLPKAVGVDLNRNYPMGWSSACAGSAVPSSETYKGAGAASEAETQTMMKFTESERFAKVMDFHSFGKQTVRGYAACLSHPFDPWLKKTAMGFSAAAPFDSANRAPDGMGEEYQMQLGRGAFAFLMETGTAFLPAYDEAAKEAREDWPAILKMISRPLSLHGHVTDRQGKPLAAGIELVGVKFTQGETYGSGGAFGAFQLVLPPAKYTLRFSAKGFSSLDTAVTVTDVSSQLLEIRLGADMARAAQNPLRSPLVFFSRPLDPATSRMILYGLDGTALRTLEVTGGTGLDGWEPRDGKGNRIPRGVYLFRTDRNEMNTVFIP